MLIVYLNDAEELSRFAVPTDDTQIAFEIACEALCLGAFEWDYDDSTTTYKAGPLTMSFAYIDGFTEI